MYNMNRGGRRQSQRIKKHEDKIPASIIGEFCPLEDMALDQYLDESKLISISQTQPITSTPMQNELMCTKCNEKDIATAKLKKKHENETEKLKKNHISKMKELQDKLDERERENVKLREQLLIKSESEEIREENKSVANKETNKQKEADENKREHTNGEQNAGNQKSDTKTYDKVETDSDNEDNFEDGEEERVKTIVQSCETKNIKIIKNKFEVCKDRSKCDNETVEVGLQCKKLHLEKEEHEKLMEDANKVKENELNIKKQKAETQYCKHHLQNRCMFQNSCWKKHVSTRDYMKTIRCKFYEEGRCRKGSNCEYKHLINTICRYFMEGTCKRGDMCTFRHIDENKIPSFLLNETIHRNKKENNPSPKENKERKTPTSDECIMEQNFQEDKRGLDQTTAVAVTQLTKTVEILQRQMEIMMENVLRERV